MLNSSSIPFPEDGGGEQFSSGLENGLPAQAKNSSSLLGEDIPILDIRNRGKCPVDTSPSDVSTSGERKASNLNRNADKLSASNVSLCYEDESIPYIDQVCSKPHDAAVQDNEISTSTISNDPNTGGCAGDIDIDACVLDTTHSVHNKLRFSGDSMSRMDSVGQTGVSESVVLVLSSGEEDESIPLIDNACSNKVSGVICLFRSVVRTYRSQNKIA